MLDDDKKRYGYKDGGKFPDLNKDGEVTYADVLKGRGVFNDGGPTGKRIVGVSDDGKYYLTNYGDGNILVENAPEELVEQWKEDGKPGTPKIKKAQGGSMDASMDERNTWQEGGDVEDQMSMLMDPQETEEQDMLPDDKMEDNYLDFIIDEALSEEEEDMLMSKLEQDEELSMLFDKVIEVASEFAGSGPVEGPGTGVSDSIPARLSDGEFVFTAKAVEEIGADNLMAMMKEAEMKADERQPVQTGGLMVEEEEVMQPTTPKMTEQVIRVEKTPEAVPTVGVQGSMLDPRRGEELNPIYEEMPFKRPPVHGAGY